MFGRFTQQAAAHDFDLEHQGFDVAGNHQVAAATQHEFLRVAPLGVGAQGHGVCLGVDAHERVRPGHDVEGVERLQGNIFLD